MLRYRSANSLAVQCRDGTVNVGQVLVAAKEFASRLRAHSDDESSGPSCILVPSSNVVGFLTALLGCRAAGWVAVPWRDETVPTEVVADVTRPDAIGTLNADGFMQVERWNGPRFQDARRGDVIMMTSGSTGQPKGVALDFDQIALNALSAGSVMQVWRCSGWSIDIDLSLMSAVSHMLMAWQYDLPFHHLAGFNQVEAEGLFAHGEVGFGGSPIQLVRFGERLLGGASPVMMVSSGDFFTPAMIDQVHARFPLAKIHKLYGLTELGGRFCCMPHDELLGKKEAAGRPLPGFQARIQRGSREGDEPGLIEAKSPLLAHGYYRSGGEFSPMPSDWFETGDVGHIADDGTITIVGRSDDVFKVGGEKVDRHTIESALSGILGDLEYCVLSVEHQIVGQCPALFVGVGVGQAPTWADVVAHLKVRLPSRFVPSLMYRLPGGLPRLANGKIDRDQLKRGHARLPRLG